MDPKNFSKDVMITNKLGLHARAAARIAEIAEDADSYVWVAKGDESVDAGSIIDLLTLGCSKGSNITIKIDNQSDIGILNRIAELIENGFGE